VGIVAEKHFEDEDGLPLLMFYGELEGQHKSAEIAYWQNRN